MEQFCTGKVVRKLKVIVYGMSWYMMIYDGM